eukprot:5402373-Amphidinium_carterae.1
MAHRRKLCGSPVIELCAASSTSLPQSHSYLQAFSRSLASHSCNAMTDKCLVLMQECNIIHKVSPCLRSACKVSCGVALSSEQHVRCYKLTCPIM